jgi:hypothetical protein
MERHSEGDVADDIQVLNQRMSETVSCPTSNTALSRTKSIARIRQRTSITEIEGNPLAGKALHDENIVVNVKVENLSDAVAIKRAELDDLIDLLLEVESNQGIIQMVELQKIPYLFASDDLLEVVEVTTSVKTKLAIISHIGPRLTDPNGRKDALIGLFRFSEEKSKVEEILKERANRLNASAFNQTGAVRIGMPAAGRGRGGAGRGGGGRGVGKARGQQRRYDKSGTDSGRTSEEDASSESITQMTGEEPKKTGFVIKSRPRTVKTSDEHERERLTAKMATNGEHNAKNDTNKSPTESVARSSMDGNGPAPVVKQEDSAARIGAAGVRSAASPSKPVRTLEGSVTESPARLAGTNQQPARNGGVACDDSPGQRRRSNKYEIEPLGDKRVADTGAIGNGLVSARLQALVSTRDSCMKTALSREPSPTRASLSSKKNLSCVYLERVSGKPDEGNSIIPDTAANGRKVVLDMAQNVIMENGSVEGPETSVLVDQAGVPDMVGGCDLLDEHVKVDAHSRPRGLSKIADLKEKFSNPGSIKTEPRKSNNPDEMPPVGKLDISQYVDNACKGSLSGDEMPPKELNRRHTATIGALGSRPRGMSGDLQESMLDMKMQEVGRPFSVHIAAKAFLEMEPEGPIETDLDGSEFFSYTELVRRNFLKDFGGLHQTELETYLTISEFESRFGLPKAEFAKQAKWRRVAQKKALLLF